MKKTFLIVFLAGICAFGVFFRLWQLSTLPAVLNRDETSIGYNAYAILRTGRDEHNQPMPLNFRCFGDYKLPGLIYLTVPFVKAFGLTPLAVRLPTALAAILSVVALAWLAKEMGFRKRVIVMAVVLVCLDFWHISQARTAYEPMLGLLISTVALASWLRGMRAPKWFLLAVPSYLISIFCYNVPWLLLPLLFFGSVVVLWRELPKKLVPVLALAGVAVAGVIGGAVLLGVNASRSEISVFNLANFTEQSKTMVYAALVAGEPSRLTRVVQSPVSLALNQVLRGYVGAFSPAYLFFDGDTNPWHNLQSIGLGNMNPAGLIWLVIGGLAVVRTAKKSSSKLLMLFLLLSPIVSGLTITSPVTNRLLDFHLFLELLMAVGFVELWQMARTKLSAQAVLIGSVGLYLLFLVAFVTRYFGVYNKVLTTAWNPQVDELVQSVARVAPAYQKIYVTSELTLGYTFFTFYTQYDPAQFAQKAERYMTGFDIVGRYDKYDFSTFPSLEEIQLKNVAHLIDQSGNMKILIIDRGEKPRLMTTPVFEIKDWQGKMQWRASATDTQTLLQLMEVTRKNDPTWPGMKKYLESCLAGSCQKPTP